MKLKFTQLFIGVTLCMLMQSGTGLSGAAMAGRNTTGKPETLAGGGQKADDAAGHCDVS